MGSVRWIVAFCLILGAGAGFWLHPDLKPGSPWANSVPSAKIKLDEKSAVLKGKSPAASIQTLGQGKDQISIVPHKVAESTLTNDVFAFEINWAYLIAGLILLVIITRRHSPRAFVYYTTLVGWYLLLLTAAHTLFDLEMYGRLILIAGTLVLLQASIWLLFMLFSDLKKITLPLLATILTGLGLSLLLIFASKTMVFLGFYFLLGIGALGIAIGFFWFLLLPSERNGRTVWANRRAEKILQALLEGKDLPFWAVFFTSLIMLLPLFFYSGPKPDIGTSLRGHDKVLQSFSHPYGSQFSQPALVSIRNADDPNQVQAQVIIKAAPLQEVANVQALDSKTMRLDFDVDPSSNRALDLVPKLRSRFDEIETRYPGTEIILGGYTARLYDLHKAQIRDIKFLAVLIFLLAMSVVIALSRSVLAGFLVLPATLIPSFVALGGLYLVLRVRADYAPVGDLWSILFLLIFVWQNAFVILWVFHMRELVLTMGARGAVRHLSMRLWPHMITILLSAVAISLILFSLISSLLAWQLAISLIFAASLGLILTQIIFLPCAAYFLQDQIWWPSRPPHWIQVKPDSE